MMQCSIVFSCLRIMLIALTLLFSASQSTTPISSPTTSNPTLSTGSSTYSGDNGQATNATINGPAGIAIDSSGNLYFSDYGNHRVRKVASSTGIITTYAGTGSTSFSGDGGAATNAVLNNPNGLCIDSSGNLYIGDGGNHRVRKVAASTFIISTIAGTGTANFSGDNGVASSAALHYPKGVAVDTSGNVYIGDQFNHRVRKITASSIVIATIAGNGVAGYSGDNGQATAAAISNPAGVNLDSAGNVYFGDFFGYNVIRKVTVSTGIISTLAGTGITSGGYNGDNIQATAATLNYPYDVVLDSYSNLYICDLMNKRVRKVTVSTGVITTIIGTGTASSTGDGSAAISASINGPIYSHFDSSGNYYISEYVGHRIRKVVTVSTDIPTAAPSKQPTYYPSLSPHSISIISTYAGTGTASYSGDNGPATSSAIYSPAGIAIDSEGNVYFSDYNNHRVRKITSSTGIITTYAGSGSPGYGGDGGVATSAALFYPNGLCIDSSGNAFIGDSSNHRVRKITKSTSGISTYAGTGSASFSGDNGLASSAALNYPKGVAVDISGNVYIGDQYNHRVRKITASTNVITTIAGTGSAGYSGDNGQATAAAITYPAGVNLDSASNVYFGDYHGYNVIRKVTISTGVISTVAGTGSASGGYNGDNIQATAATLNFPYDVVLDSYSNLYICDLSNNRVRKVDVSTGLITTIIGTGTASSTGDGGAATSATIYGPCFCRFDSAGNFYTSEYNGNRIRKVETVSTDIPTAIPTPTPTTAAPTSTTPTIVPTRIPTANPSLAPSVSPTSIPSTTPSTASPSISLSPSTAFVITTIAGTGATSYSGDNGAATSAALYSPGAVTVDASGNIYIADTYNHRFRKVTVSTGIITTVAGSGGSGSYSGDNGPATSATLSLPYGIALDSAGNVYIADSRNQRIRKVTVSTGIITTIAGTGTSSYSGDNGPATSATLNDPYGIVLDSPGNVYFADCYNQRIRKVTISTGIITTIAGNGGTGSYSGDVGAATSATLNFPWGVALDASGNVYIADSSNRRIRKVTVSTGIITTIAGTGTSSYSGDNGLATAATLSSPCGVGLDATGNVYIADTLNNRVRKLTISTGVITTIAGSGVLSYSGDGGSATAAALFSPQGVSVDLSGNVYIADSSNHRVRKVTVGETYSPSTSPTLKPSTSTPSTVVPSSSYPSLSPNTVFIVTTIAGNGTAGYSGDGGAATSAGLNNAFGVALDASGNVYIADSRNNRIRKVTVSTGIISIIAGTGTYGYSGDNGQATSATLKLPSGVAVDTIGNLYVADQLNNCIRKVTVSTGIITTFAGNGTASYSGDNGPATSANLYYPFGVALDSAGNVYIADSINQRIRKVTVSTGIITTIAGTGTQSYSGDGGAATAATLNSPFGIAFDLSGNVYIADWGNNRVRKVTVSGIITTFAGTGTSTFSGDGGQATSAALYYPCGVGLDSSGNVYITDSHNQRIRKVTISTGIITTYAGNGTKSYSGDGGAATAAAFYYPFGIALDSADNVYIADYSNQRIRKVAVGGTYSPSVTPALTPTLIPSTSSPSLSPSIGIITTIAGTGSTSYSGDNGQATSAALYNPTGVVLDASGNVYIADYGNNRIRKVTISTGIIITLAGNGGGSYSGDNGPATSATLYFPTGVALDSTGNIYIADQYNQRIRKVTVSTGIITTIAGTGVASYSGDNGPATSATLKYPAGVALDSAGNVYIADQWNHRIRKVTVSTGIIDTFAGTGTASYSGDNGQAANAALSYPYGVALDSSGNVYIGDYGNHRIRKVTVSTGIITTIAGTGASSYSGDGGPATSATLYSPSGVSVDSAGDVYIADFKNCRIRKVTISTGIISTYAGTGTSSYSGDGGSATAAALNNPIGVSLDASGNLYIADLDNNRIRKVTVSTSSSSSVNPSASPSTTSPTPIPSVSPSVVPSAASTSTPSNFPSLSPSAAFTITTIAGTGTTSYSGDNGQATAAAMYLPMGIALDSSGDVYIADYGNHRIRKVTVSTGIITTFAGTGIGSYSGDGGAATSATLNSPYGVTLDSTGNIYIGDQNNHRVRKVTVTTGIITTIAGTGASSYNGDGGAATSAALSYPSGVALDSTGDVYIADQYNNRIRKVTVSTGIITTIVGTGTKSYSGDNGAATSAALNYPIGVALDSSGNVYIADEYNQRIRKVTTSTGIITAIAGNGGTGSYSGDNGQATSAALNYPSGVSVDYAGDVYIADYGNNRIRKVTVSTGIITTVAGTGTGSYSGDGGVATAAGLNSPQGVMIDASGNVYITDTNNHRVRKVTVSTTSSPSFIPSVSPTPIPSASPTRVPSTLPSTFTPSSIYPSLSPSTVFVITTLAGTGIGSYSGDNGLATAATLNIPSGVALDSAGNVYIADNYNHRVRKVTVSTGIITTIAGTGTPSYSGDNGQATSATLDLPYGVALDSAGNVYISDSNNQRVRKVTISTGIITTIAGNSTSGSYSGDNKQATSTGLHIPRGVSVDASGNVYIADMGNNRIRKVTVSTGIITTIAGSGGTTGSYSGDNGPATTAAFNYPWGVALDTSGNVYIADTQNNRIRKVTVSTGIITTLAGTGNGDYSGDNGPATSAALNIPIGVSLDASGNIYIGDMNNNRIRKVTVSTGIINTIAGSSTSGSYSGDGGAATAATLNQPYGVSLDSSGNVYIADSTNQRIRKVTAATTTSDPGVMPTPAPTQIPSMSPSLVPSTSPPSTSTPSSNYPSLSPSTVFIITTIAGSSTSGYSGDNGAATSAGLYYPHGVVLDSSGNVYLTDFFYNRVRKVTVSTGIITTIAGTGTQIYSGDNGPATSAGLYNPFGVALDSAANIYIADFNNHRIRKVTVSTGIITLIAGTGTSSYSGDGGAATSAALNYPSGVALDATGNVLIADSGNNRVRKVTVSTGIITTIAGTGTASYSGDGGLATSATLNYPQGIALDSAGNVYIGDTYNNRIRKVTISTGLITSIAGTGTATYSGDGGQATSAGLNSPVGVTLDSAGNVYIADSNNNRIRKVTVSAGIITTIAGTGSRTYSGDNGPATSAALNIPQGVSLDTSGNVYIADTNNHRIRKVTVPTTPLPSATPTATASTTSPNYSPSNSPSVTVETATPSIASTLSPTTASPSVTPSETTQPSLSPAATPSIAPTSLLPTMIPSTALPSTYKPTTNPTWQPTSQPTSSPTPLDVIAVNTFDTEITPKVVRIKVKFYLLTFATYFLACFIILMFVDFSRVGKSATKRLHASAYASNTYTPKETFMELHEEVHSKIDQANSKAKKNVFNKLKKKDYEISKLQLDEVKFRTLSAEQSSSKGKATLSLKLVESNRLAGKSDGYSEGFYAYIDQNRTHLGCEPILYPDGKVGLGSCLPSVTLERSVMEDFLMFLCNNHSVLNCIYACDGSPVDRTGNRLIYITQNCIAFFLSAISGSIFDFIDFPSSVNYAFDLVVITPATIAIAKLMKVLYTCPIGFSVEYQVTHPMTVCVVKWLGKLAIIPIFSLIIALLVLAAIFTRGRNTTKILLSFLLSVQMYGFFLELIFTMLMFVSTFYMRSSIDLWCRSIVLLEVGRRYTELIYSNKLVEGRDYHYRCYYLFCFLRIECIYRFDDAVKKGYVKEEDRIQADVEMTVSSVLHQQRGRGSNAAARETKDDNIPIIDSNDADEVFHRYSSFQEADDMYVGYKTSRDSFKEGGNVYGDYYESSAYDDSHKEGDAGDDVYVGYEASYDTNKEGGDVYVGHEASYNSHHQQQEELLYSVNTKPSREISNPMIQQSLNWMNNASNMAVEEVEMEGIVSQISASKPNYTITQQQQQQQHIDYDIDATEEDMTPVRRKAFKDGTRGSFIEVYRKFEEQEIIGGVSSASSDRVNQFHAALNSSKNILTNKRK